MWPILYEQGRKRPLGTPKRIIERREREGERERNLEGEIYIYIERDVRDIYRKRVKGRGIERESERKKIERKRRLFGKSPKPRNKA